jgi:inner membrane protein
METVIESVWSKSKLFIKALLIGAMALLLMIPTFFVRELIEEREARQKEAVLEVSSKWAGRQNIAGPVLVLPYLHYAADSAKTATRHFAFFLPDELNITSTVQPQERSRGIYKVMLYNASADISGSFKNISLDKLKIAPEHVVWNEAFIKMNISDPKGLNEELKMEWNDSNVTLTPQPYDGLFTGEGLSASIPISAATLQQNSFSAKFAINGSEQILFTPLGKTTTVSLNSSWPDPSFTGSTLPQTTNVTKDGFSAKWQSFSHKRNFPQQWKDVSFNTDQVGSSDVTTTVPANTSSYNIGTAAFGANLFIPVNGYQKTLRSIKYAILCILLTFSAFFLMDVIHKKSVHPFQYGLIGLALILFYLLLLSFSEYTGFDAAYIIASVATIGLIAWFVKGLLKSGRLSTLLSLILLFVYAYVFTILQLQDYALLIGSIGLFLTLGVIMYFSKRFQW